MTHLHELHNTSRPRKARKRVGRGIGSGWGKTAARGHKGAGSRSGWRARARYEGGQMPLYRKLPGRGFSNERFRKRCHEVSLGDIDYFFRDGEVVNLASLQAKGVVKGRSYGVKLLSEGTLSRKVTIELHAYSEKAALKLRELGVAYSVV